MGGGLQLGNTGGGSGSSTSSAIAGSGSKQTYRSPEDFAAAYASAITLALTNLPFPPVLDEFVVVAELDGDAIIKTYDITDTDYNWTWTPGADTTTGTLSVDTATFVNTSTFIVLIRGPQKDELDVLTDFAGPYVHQSPRDFAAARTAATTIAITGMAFDPDVDDIRAVVELLASGLVRVTYTRREWAFTWAAGVTGAGVLTIASATLQVGSTFIVLIEGTEHNTKLAATTATVGTRVKQAQLIDQFGNIPIDHNSHGGSYHSPDDFIAVYTSATTLTLSLLPFPALFQNFVSVAEYNGDNLLALYKIEDLTYDWTWTPAGADASGGVLTVDTATFGASSTYVVTIRGPEKAYLELNSDVSGLNTHRSPRDFAVAWTDATTLAVTGMEFDPSEADILGVIEWTAGNLITMTYTPRHNAFAWTAGAAGEGTLVVTGATFVSGSTFIVFIAGTEHNTSDANTARTTGTRVKHAQLIGADGNATPSGFDADAAIFTRLLGLMAAASGPGIYVSPIQFTAVYQAATAVDLAGHPAITDVSQFLAVVQISSAGAVTVHYPHISTGAFSWSAANDRLTVTAATFANTDVFGVVVRGADRYANEPGNFLMTGEVNPYELTGDSAGIATLSALQAFTNAWVDMGSPIPMLGKGGLTLFLTLDINDDSNLRVRALGTHESGGTEEYPLSIASPGAAVVEVEAGYVEFTDDSDQLIPVDIITSGRHVTVQPQIMRGTDGAGVDSEVDACRHIRSPLLGGE